MVEEGGLERVEALMDLGRLDQARALLLSILGSRPEDGEALRLLAACHHRAGDRRAALEAADLAVAADPDAEWGHRLRAHALLSLGRLKEALRAAGEAVMLQPASWAGHLMVGAAAAYVRGESKRSQEAFRRAASLAPGEAEVPYVRGHVLHTLNRTWAARRAYRQA